MKQILIATDGSPSAREAVDVGLELAREQGADVTFVHVTGPHADRDEAEAPLRTAAPAAEAAGVSYALERISGDTVDMIVALADTKEADLIVVGSRGRNPVTTALLGSVSHGLLRRAGRPVLVVKGTNVAAAT